MKKFAAYIFILISTFLLGFGFYSISPTGIAERDVLALMHQLHNAEQNKDKEKLNKILADEIIWSRNNERKLRTKDNIIEYIDDNTLHIESIKTFFVSTKIENDRALVYFTMVETAFFDSSAKPITHTGDYTYAFERQQNEWKLTAIHLEN